MTPPDDDTLLGFVLGELDPADAQAVRDALARDATVRARLAALHQALAAGFEALPSAPPALAGLDRLRAALHTTPRLQDHIDAVADLLDCDAAAAAHWLQQVDRADAWSDGPLPHVRVLHVQGGPRIANHIAGFLRVPAGTGFPEHTHLGEEAVLIVQGHLDDSGTRHGPGSLLRQHAGTSHSFTVPPGVDLIYLLVLAGGVAIGDQQFVPGDPSV